MDDGTMNKHHKHEKEKPPPASGAGPAVEEAPETPVTPPAAGEDESAPAADETSMLKDRILRLQADFDNFRRRTAKERSEWQVFALEDLIQEILPVVDHFEMGLATAGKHNTDAAVLDGFRMVYDQMLAVLRKNGVTQLSAEPGAAFDPHQHEAISHIPSEEHGPDVIIAETRKGYRLGEKMIRPLQVVVSSGPAGDAESGGN